VHALQLEMEKVLSAGRNPAVADFGNLHNILSHPEVVAATPFAPEFVTLVMDESGPEIESTASFVAEVLMRARQDITISELVDVMVDYAPLPAPLEQRCFLHWLGLANGRDNPTSVRTAALRGALLMKRQDARRTARLAGDIALSDVADDPDYLAHAARIGGYLHAEAPNDGIVAFFQALLDQDAATDEASFELGMSRVGLAFAAGTTDAAREHFNEARSLFEKASARREARADAKVLAIAIGLLEGFYQGQITQLATPLEELRREAFAYAAYSDFEDDFLAGAKSVEVAAWASLAVRLDTLDETLQKPAWLDAVRIIETELLVIYSASRSIFRRSIDGGLEWLVRPRIEASLSRNHAQLYVLRDWLMEKGEGEIGAAAADLIAGTESALGGAPPRPTKAAPRSPGVAAVLETGSLSYLDRERITHDVITNVGLIEKENISPTLVHAVASVAKAFEAIPEIANVPQTKILVETMIYKTLLFLETRLDMTPGVDPTVKYLFVADSEPHPLEKDLQQDFIRFLRNGKLGTVSELAGVGGGRVDVSHSYKGSRFVTEVKREASDASFENLLTAYGEQTALYQITNIPIGILLVLDLTTSNGLSGDLRTLYKPAIGDLLKDGVSRGVLIVRVPTRRISPSAATVAAKKAAVVTPKPKRTRIAKPR
jgi:hypothetical protein